MIQQKSLPVIQIETLLSEFEGKPRNRKLDEFINEDNWRPTHGINHADLQCGMCWTLRDQLKKCADCQTFICVPCLNRYKEPLCPYCRTKPFACNDLNRFEQSHLDWLNFKCTECSEPFEFKERRKHMQTCQEQNNPKLFTYERLIFTCKCCNPVIIRSENYFCRKKALK